MECLTEFTCSVYVDGELTDQEFRKVEEHLESCERCRTMSAAFREENRLLVACIQEIDLSEPAEASLPVRATVPAAKQVRPVDLLKWAGMLIGLATLIRIAVSSPENFALPSIPVNLDWLNPSNLAGRMNWLMGTIAYLAGEGVNKMTTLVDGLSFVALIVLISAGVVIVVRRSIGKNAMVAVLGLLLVIVSSASGFAMDVRTPGQDKVMTLAEGQTVDDNLFATGDTVIINGIVTGDLIAFARQVKINGTVKGNVLTFAGSVDIAGVVEGTVISGGQTIQVSGKLAHNFVGFSQSITIGKDATIGGDAAGFGNDTHMNGNIAHSLYSFGMADISGTIGRNVVFRGANLSVLPSARIAGNLKSYVPKAEMVHIDPAAMIGGSQSIELPMPGPSRYATFGFYFSEILHVAAAFIAGFLLFLIFPRLRSVGFSDAVSVLKSGGIGFLLVFASPIAAVIVACTVIGLPVGFVGFLVWLVGLYLAKIVVANFIGRTLLSSQADRMSAVALGLIVGLVLTFTAINLPYIGGLIHFVLVLIGFGAIAMTLYGSTQAVPDSGR